MTDIINVPHDYLSTACYHGLHDRCRQSCKFCSTPCRCACHRGQRDIETSETQPPVYDGKSEAQHAAARERPFDHEP